VTEPAQGLPAVEAPPASAAALFGDRFALAVRYTELLVGDGVVRGLIGPREADRIWSRHVLNSAVTGALYADGDRIVDVGSGAGLPGIPVALARPDVRIDLVEPLARRAEFLREVVAQLGLGSQVRVVRGRAEDPAVVAEVGEAAWVTSRAVAPLPRLVRWCLPLIRSGGGVAALKGASAQQEIDAFRSQARSLGAADLKVVRCGEGIVDPAVSVVTARRVPTSTRARRGSK